MQNTSKAFLSLFFLLSLFVGVCGFYYQAISKANTIELSDLSDNNDEEDLSKEDFTKRIVFEDLYKDSFFVLSHRIIRLFITPDCLLEGHTGQVTPPPWS